MLDRVPACLITCLPTSLRPIPLAQSFSHPQAVVNPFAGPKDRSLVQPRAILRKHATAWYVAQPHAIAGPSLVPQPAPCSRSLLRPVPQPALRHSTRTCRCLSCCPSPHRLPAPHLAPGCCWSRRPIPWQAPGHPPIPTPGPSSSPTQSSIPSLVPPSGPSICSAPPYANMPWLGPSCSPAQFAGSS